MDTKIGSETIRMHLDNMKDKIMELTYGDGERDDFDAIISINEIMETILGCVQDIEKDRNRAEEQARKMRIQWGNAFGDECDAVGIK